MTRTGEANPEKRGAYELSEDRTRLAVVRSHLANERTFLSWLRTALTVMTFGFVLGKLDLFLTDKQGAQYRSLIKALEYMGLAAVILGGLLLIMAARRYYSVRKHIGQGEAGFSPAPDVAVLATVALLFLFSLIFMGSLFK